MRLTTGLLVLACGGLLAAPVAAQDRIAYATTSTQSSTYTYAVAAAKAMNSVSGDKIDVTVISTGGAVDNLARMARGQVNLGLGNMAAVYQAYTGTGRFEGKAQPKLRALWLYQTSLQPYIVVADSGVETLEGLGGKPWTAGQRGSATEALVVQTMDILGIKPDYYRASLSDALTAIKNGESIGYVKAMAGRSLDSATLELATSVPIRILSFDKEQADKVLEQLPYLSFVTVAPGTVQGYDGGFTTWASSSGHYTYSDLLSDDQVAAILTGIIDGKKIQEEVWPVFRNLDIAANTLENSTIPLHAGAVKFYRSRGYTVPDRLIPPEMK